MITILIVEDEEAIANLIRMNLVKAGYRCEIASDGEEAADKIAARAYDLILLDIMLPKLNGYEVLEYAKTVDIPVIFLTAMGETQQKVKGLKMGAEDYISKPFEIAELLARVETVQAQEGILYGDRDLLSTVFINFLDNARKALEKGSCIRLTGRKDSDGYVMIVEDEGIGIPEEELARITEAFYMVDKSRARKEGGAGLGLALCRKILYLHRALWKIESAPGKGTKITVSFHMAERGKRERRKRRNRDGR